jgi:hypothetical protein
MPRLSKDLLNQASPENSCSSGPPKVNSIPMFDLFSKIHIGDWPQWTLEIHPPKAKASILSSLQIKVFS